MLYWICPECGHECSPAIRECPTCTEAAAAPPVSESPARQTSVAQNHASQELLSLAQNFPSTSTALLAPAAQPQLLSSANGRDTSIATTAVAVEEEPPDPPPSRKLQPFDDLELASARPGPVTPVRPSASPVPPRPSSPPVLPVSAPAQGEFRFRMADAAPAGEVDLEPAQAKSQPVPQPAEPLPSRRQAVAFVRPEWPASGSGMVAVADRTEIPELADAKSLKPLPPPATGQPARRTSSQFAYTPENPRVTRSEVELSGASLVELLNALKASAEELERAGVEAIHATFRREPAAAMLAAPSEIVAPPAPPSEQWMAARKPTFTPVPPRDTQHTATAGPQAPPLAGPSLPRRLLDLDQKNSGLRAHRRRASSWLINGLLAVIVIIATMGVFNYLTQDRDTRAASAAAARAGQDQGSYRDLEVAGVRVIAGANKRPQLEYLVINHSSSDLTNLSVHLVIRSADSSSEEPLFTVTSTISSLAPFQSKEIHAEVNSALQPSDIPDWQSLRPEVVFGHQ